MDGSCNEREGHDYGGHYPQKVARTRHRVSKRAGEKHTGHPIFRQRVKTSPREKVVDLCASTKTHVYRSSLDARGASPAGRRTRALLQCTRSHRMADWKQITARIRRARTGKDPVAQLSNLFEKTN